MIINGDKFNKNIIQQYQTVDHEEIKKISIRTST